MGLDAGVHKNDTTAQITAAILRAGAVTACTHFTCRNLRPHPVFARTTHPLPLTPHKSKGATPCARNAP
jgi:hypothetical protein